MSILFRYGKVCGGAFTFCLDDGKGTCELLNVFLFDALVDGAADFLYEAHFVKVFNEVEGLFEKVLVGVLIDVIAFVFFCEIGVFELNFHV